MAHIFNNLNERCELSRTDINKYHYPSIYLVILLQLHSAYVYFATFFSVSNETNTFLTLFFIHSLACDFELTSNGTYQPRHLIR